MTRQTEEELGRQHQGMDRPGVRQVPEGSGEQGKMEKTGCKIMRGASTTLAVKELMMMMMNCTKHRHPSSPVARCSLFDVQHETCVLTLLEKKNISKRSVVGFNQAVTCNGVLHT